MAATNSTIVGVVYQYLMDADKDLAEMYKTKFNPPTLEESVPTLAQLFTRYQKSGTQNGQNGCSSTPDSEVDQPNSKHATINESSQKITKKSSEADSDSEDEPPPKKIALTVPPARFTPVKQPPQQQALNLSNNNKPKPKESTDFKKWKTVISYLNLKDQKNCRLVNKLLNEVTSAVMLAQDRCQISVEFHQSGDAKKNTQVSFFQIVQNRHYGGHTLTDSGIDEKKSLRELTACLKNSVKFPCSSFGFSWCDLSAQDVAKFFAVFGPQIKSLALHESSYFSNRTPLNNFREILQNQAPNITHFKLNGFAYKWAERDEMSLPSLTHLTFDKYWGASAGDLKTKKQLLQAACKHWDTKYCLERFATYLNFRLETKV